MPGRRGGPIDNTLCRRCQTTEPAITVRNEPLCKACFTRYVSTKVVKRMESFRVRHSTPHHEPTLLLPLSFGAGSTALLHLLSEHLKGQVRNTGRVGFKLHILHILDSSSPEPDPEALLEKVKQRYPEHTYSTSPLAEILSSPPLFSQHGLNLDQNSPPEHQLQDLLTSLPSPSARKDTLQILRRKQTVHFARAHTHDAILWGDSTTRLAERTLSETAKGRGYAIPWVVADGESPQEAGIPFFYPLRELLSKEIHSFTRLLDDPPLTDLLLTENDDKPAISTKNTTIDDLMRGYFASVERDYPSIVANVVRTAGKLQKGEVSAEHRCELCEMPLGEEGRRRNRLCYGCVRSFPAAGPVG